MAEVKIYWSEFRREALTDSTIQRLNKVLSLPFQLSRTSAKMSQEISFFSKMLLHEVLENEFNIKNPLSHFTKDSNGKPVFPNLDLHFNISHSNELVGIAVCEKAKIGFDIQIQKDYSQGILPKVFCEFEQQAYQESDEPDHFFFDVWSKKEASVKATGKGIKTGLNSFSVLEKRLDLDQHELHLEPVQIKENYFSAVAVNNPISKISIQNFQI